MLCCQLYIVWQPLENNELFAFWKTLRQQCRIVSSANECVKFHSRKFLYEFHAWLRVVPFHRRRQTIQTCRCPIRLHALFKKCNFVRLNIIAEHRNECRLCDVSCLKFEAVEWIRDGLNDQCFIRSIARTRYGIFISDLLRCLPSRLVNIQLPFRLTSFGEFGHSCLGHRTWTQRIEFNAWAAVNRKIKLRYIRLWLIIYYFIKWSSIENSLCAPFAMLYAFSITRTYRSNEYSQHGLGCTRHSRRFQLEIVSRIFVVRTTPMCATELHIYHLHLVIFMNRKKYDIQKQTNGKNTNQKA